MVQEASLDTLALAGAMAAALFAALTYMLGRQSHRTSALIWWAAAFAVESLRLALIFLVDSPDSGRAEIVGAGGHAFVAVTILIGVQAWFDRPRHRQGHWALAGLTTAIMLAGLLDPGATGPAASLLYALAVSPLAVAVWLFWQSQRSGTRPSDLFAAVALTLFIFHLASRALSSLGVGAETHGVGEWDALAHVGLSFLALTCLVITAQHRAFLAGREGQERLAVSEQRFRDMAEVAGDWVWETGPDMRYTYFSDRAQEPVGVDPKHLLGRTRRDLMGGDPQQPHLCAHLKDLDARRSFRNFEYSFDPGVGGKRYLRVSGKPIYDARGQFLGYRGTGTDVTEEVVAKRTAELLDRRLKDAFEGMPYAVALFDADDRLVLYNSKLATIYPNAESLMVPGRRFEEILRAAAARELFPAAGDDLALYIEERLEQHRTATAMPFQQLLSDGRWVQITESRTGDRGTVTAWSDITWLKRREAAPALLLQSDPEDDSFFDVAAEALSTGLDCRWTGIGRLSGERFEVLATQGGGWPDDVPNRDLKGGPGGKVIESRGYLAIPDRASELFPEETMLAELGVVSYQGHAFLDAEGNVLGHVFAMNDRAETANSHNRELVSLVARWVGAEFERRCAKQDLRESEARFRDYAETSADWFWETDMEQRFTSCIHSVAASAGSNIMVGKTRDEVQELIHAEPNLAPIVAGYMAKGEEFRGLEFRCNDPKLGTRWVRVSGRPMHALDGELVGYRGTGRDVTDQVAARNEREEAAKLLEAVFENMAQGISVTDADLNVVAFNHRFLDLLKFPEDRFEIGDPFEKFIRYNAERGEYGPGDPDQQVRERIELAKQCKPHYLERTRPDGVVLEIRGNPLPGGGFVTTYTDVTERKQAETALRGSQASLANAQRIARLGNWDWNVATGEFVWSEEVYRIFDRDPDDFEPTYEAFLNAVHPEDRPQVQKAVSNALAGYPYSLDHRIILPDRGTRIIHEQGEVEFDENGKAAVMRGIIQDVTEYRKAVNAVREGERHVRAIMESVPDSLVTIDEAGIIRSVNPAVERMFGYKAAELIGENVSILMPEPHRLEHDNYIRRYLATGKGKILGVGARDVAGRRKDGSLIDVELTSSEMWYGGDRVFIGVMRDITARRQANEALRQKTAFIELSKTTAAAANEASSVEEALEICVAEVCRHFGWPAGHAYVPVPDGSGELSPSMIWHLADSQKFLALRQITMRSRFAPGEGLPGRVSATRRPVWISDIYKDTNFPRAQAGVDIGVTAAIGFPVLIGTEVAAVLEFFAEEAIEPDESALEAMTHIGKQIGRVIERARAERQLLSAKDAAERADRTKGEFLATMSHELRTPLNAIIGFSEIMGQELYGPLGHGTYKEYADDIQTSGTHLLNIINDILDVSKAEAGMIALADDSVDLAEAIETSLRMFKPRALEKGIDFELDLPQAATRVRGDRQRLNQVLLNLLSNAVKFTNQGRITVRLRWNSADGVLLQIVDTGIGIPEADLERIMEPFTQADSTLSRTHEGTGLGLPLSRVFVEAHDGKLTIESVFGEGSTATLHLPASRLLSAADAA
jgi:PAS domain S-box-containing protein